MIHQNKIVEMCGKTVKPNINVSFRSVGSFSFESADHESYSQPWICAGRRRCR